MNLSDYTLRRAGHPDATTITGHRRSMFSDMGYEEESLDPMSLHFLGWVKPRLCNGEYLAWLAVAPDGSVAAGMGLWLMDWPPPMVGPDVRRGNIVNVYTERGHRRLGLARLLMNTALEWCGENGIRTVILHASMEGRSLYESLGFLPTNEMRLMLSKPET